MAQSAEPPSLDLVYSPSEYFGVVFAERDIARRAAQVWRAVQESTTWGEFRATMPAADWEEVLNQLGGDIPSDDGSFEPNDIDWGYDGNFVGPWPPSDALEWFPDDLIDKYGGEIDWGNPNHNQLFLPGEAANEIADELRSRGHQVEETNNGDLNYWLSSLYGPSEAPTSEPSPPSSTRRPIFLISTEGKSEDQVKAEARQAFEKYPRESPRDQGETRDSWQPPPGETMWDPYFQAMFPPGRVTEWDNFKRMSTGVNVVRRLWDQREEMRQEYEALNGTNQAQWPTQHPGIVLDAVPWIAHPACLGCHWFHHGVSMTEADWQQHAVELALRHQDSDGAYNDDGRD